MLNDEATEIVIAEVMREIPNIMEEENQYTLAKIESMGGPKACYKEILKSVACLVKLLIDVKKSE